VLPQKTHYFAAVNSQLDLLQAGEMFFAAGEHLLASIQNALPRGLLQELEKAGAKQELLR
jgi:hypothetical protein